MFLAVVHWREEPTQASASARIVDGASGAAFPGVVPVPSVPMSLPESRALQEFIGLPLIKETRIWESIGASLTKAAEELGADLLAPIEYAGKVQASLIVIRLDAQNERLLLRHAGRDDGSRLILPWPPERWTEEQRRAARTFSVMLATAEACGSILISAQGKPKTHLASLVLAELRREPGVSRDAWQQLRLDIGRTPIKALNVPDQVLSAKHGVLRAFIRLARRARPTQWVDVKSVDDLVERAILLYDLQLPCDSVALLDLVRLTHQGGLAAEAQIFMSQRGLHVKDVQHSIWMDPAGLHACVCGHEFDFQSETSRSTGRRVCVQCFSKWEEQGRHFHPIRVDLTDRC